MKPVVSAVLVALMAFVMLPASSAASPRERAGDGAPALDGPEDGADKGGCCAHHAGVCGCNADHKMCCDGSTSPTCRCPSN